MKFATIIADPPWEYPEGFAGGPGHGNWTPIPLPYPSLSVNEICALPVKEFAVKDCRLFLWATNRFLPASLQVIKSWGFKYRQILVWHKIDSNLGGSVAPNSAEFLMVAVKGHPRINQKSKSSVIRTPHGRRHSQKPEEFQSLIETVSPGPYLEMFARRKRPGWSSWGNEIESDVEIAT